MASRHACRPGFLLMVAALAGAATTAAQAACPQALAVYSEAGSNAEIAFSGPLGEADSMSHRFGLSFAGSGVMMEGVVMMAGEPDRPWGVVLHECPQGDATGAEIDACTVWQGPIYALDESGGAGWLTLAAGPQPASASLLLPDFSAAVMQSKAWREKRIEHLPGDVFRLSGCQE
ncbi:hypothetical protein OEG84_14515 [Hoeflea sp. G2-23]|uniref:Uncharacterized protein n=1 Tax=Hoeflea algicola TaxID=2983763 RepID=A0ABT3ZCD3_9HYPH|nr:hypothetical protein [Hoeflea algicola]MCY0148881.1 hypothetical protein [Hoeflea algicola]